MDMTRGERVPARAVNDLVVLVKGFKMSAVGRG